MNREKNDERDRRRDDRQMDVLVKIPQGGMHVSRR